MQAKSPHIPLFSRALTQEKRERGYCVTTSTCGSIQRGAHGEGGEEGGEAGVVLVAVAGDEAELVLALASVFHGGVVQAEADGVLAVRLAAAQARLKLRGRDVDVDVRIGAADGGVIARADACRALYVNVHHDVPAAFQQADYLRAQGAIRVAVYAGVLQEFAGGDFGGELLRREEVVVHAILLPRAGRARGAGDGV